MTVFFALKYMVWVKGYDEQSQQLGSSSYISKRELKMRERYHSLTKNLRYNEQTKKLDIFKGIFTTHHGS